MHYEKPEMVEIKMDAEIGSYQNDFDPGPRFAAPDDDRAATEARPEAG
ncbi:MAG: hypothetical protein U0359_03805 [Byssovorax sp.]